MLLWRDFIYTEICEGYARKSSKLFYISAPKVEQYYLQSLTYLARVNIKNNSSHDFAAYIFTSQHASNNVFSQEEYTLMLVWGLWSVLYAVLVLILIPLSCFTMLKHIPGRIILHIVCILIAVYAFITILRIYR
jgi:hypothetical protein